jgi:CRP-like cAMP-binding protein
LARHESTQVQVRDTYERSFAEQAVLFEEGDLGDVLYIIQSGEIELTRQGPAGRRMVARLGPGEFFGEMSVVLGETRSARAVAVRASRVLELDGETLEAMCIERPEIAIRIISRLTTRLIESERRLAALGIDDLLRPIVRALVRDAKPHPKQGVRIGTTLRRLASDAGLSMLEAHRAVHQLLDQKLIRLVDDVLVAKDVETLSACLDLPS